MIFKSLAYNTSLSREEKKSCEKLLDDYLKGVVVLGWKIKLMLLIDSRDSK